MSDGLHGTTALAAGLAPGEISGPRNAFGSPAIRQVVAFCLAAGIFWLDSASGIGVAFATLYALVLIIASDRADRLRLVGWSLGCSALTLFSFSVVHGGQAGLESILRLIISLGANAVTTGLLLHRQVMDNRVQQEESRYESVLNSLAIAIWEHDFRPVEAAIAAVRENGVADLKSWLVENPDFVVETRKLVRITDVNETALELMCVPTKQAFFDKLSDFLPECDESFSECILAIDERREMFQAETQVITSEGEPIDIIVAFSLSPDRSLDRVPGSILDIRQRKRLETAIERARIELDNVQRSAAIGAMSASIAHEINQPLSAIQSFANAATRWLERDEPDLGEVRQSLDGLNSAVGNVYEVMQRVRDLVGSSRGEAVPLNLRALITDTVAFALRDAEAHGAKIVFASSNCDVTILGDRVLLKHLLLNLITNALQAMEDTPRGEKLIEIELQSADQVALVSMRDRGPGLHSSAADKQFEPFFTTKPGGMGLGLAICRSIVEVHEGAIHLTNHPEGGARVTLTLPGLA